MFLACAHARMLGSFPECQQECMQRWKDIQDARTHASVLQRMLQYYSAYIHIYFLKLRKENAEIAFTSPRSKTSLKLGAKLESNRELHIQLCLT